MNVYKVSLDLASGSFNIFKNIYIHPAVSTSNWDWYKKPGGNSKGNSLVTLLTLLFQTYINQNSICLIQKFTSKCGKVNSLLQGFIFLQTPFYKHMLNFLQNIQNFRSNPKNTEKFCSISTTFQLLKINRKLLHC